MGRKKGIKKNAEQQQQQLSDDTPHRAQPLRCRPLYRTFWGSGSEAPTPPKKNIITGGANKTAHDEDELGELAHGTAFAIAVAELDGLKKIDVQPSSSLVTQTSGLRIVNTSAHHENSTSGTVIMMIIMIKI